MDRKASDIILDIERKIDTILQYVKTNDLNNKLILDRLNKLIAAASSPSSPKPEVVNKPKPTAVTQPSVSAPIIKQPLVAKPLPAEYEFNDVDEDGNPQIQEELSPLGGRRDRSAPTSTSSDNKVQVEQKILYQDKKNVILASVEIFTTDNKGNKQIIKQTRTNSAGKWSAKLDPGKYFIHVFKSATTNKSVVEMDYEIEIPLSNGAPLELPSQQQA